MIVPYAYDLEIFNNMFSGIYMSITDYLKTFADCVNDKGKPIIIGCLFKESGNTSQVNIEVNNLTVVSKTNLNADITIGDISYEELKYLKGLKQNIQSTIENIQERLENLEGNN